MGHGQETAIDMKHRWIVPEGVMIIYENQCGEPLLSETGYKKLHEFIKGNRKLLNPVRYKEELAALFGLDDIKIYGPGARIPEIEIVFMNSHSIYDLIVEEGDYKDKYIDSHFLLKSGVYKFPIDPKSITTGRRCKKGGIITECKWGKNEIDPRLDVELRTTFGDLFLHANRNDDVETLKKKIQAAFRGSIYPRARDMKHEFGNATQEYLAEALDHGMTFFSMKYDLKTIIDYLGGGIYYLTSCRSLKCPIEEDTLAGILQESEEQQENAKSALKAITKLGNMPRKPAMSGKKRRKEAVAANNAVAASAVVANTNAASAFAHTPNNRTHKKQREENAVVAPYNNWLTRVSSTRKKQHTINKSARRSGLKGKSLKRFVNRLKLKWGAPGK